MTAIIPVGIGFKDWANQLRNSFPTQDIPIWMSSEKEWRSFYSMLSSNRCFDGKFIPQVGGFSNWRDWASEFLFSVGA